MERRLTPIHEALYRPQSFMGGERTPMQLLLAFCVGLPFASMNIPSAVACFGVWAVGMFALRTAFKADPHMLGIWWKSRNDKNFYPARSEHWLVEERSFR